MVSDWLCVDSRYTLCSYSAILLSCACAIFITCLQLTCSNVASEQVDALQVWLDASLNANDMPEDPCQLPFPPEMQAIDLGPVVNDAIMLALPSANLCGQADCSIRCEYICCCKFSILCCRGTAHANHQGACAVAEVRDSGQTTGWSAGPSEQQLKLKTQSQADFKRSGHFAALQKLKSKSTR
jgi:uncharacterized metal-binding protein YceD (DUF177 family)